MFKLMKAFIYAFCLLAVFLFAALPVQAALVSCDGGSLSSGNCPIEIDDSGNINFYGAELQKIEVATTSDTLTAAESGTIYIYEPASTQSIITLPTAAEGLTYKFVQAVGSKAGLKKLILDPASSDTFVGCGVTSSSTTTFAAGDSIISSVNTGDSLTIVGNTSKWYCIDSVGTWADNN